MNTPQIRLIGTRLAVAFIVGCSLMSCLAGCHLGYYARAGYEQSRILFLREPIAELVSDPSLDLITSRKLRLALDARAFAHSIGLLPGEAYTKYADVGREVLAWVVVGCRPDAFEPHVWWFPIIGSVPYKGFFDREDAECEVHALERAGFEASLRPTDAFSTLGWFDDPVLSTMLARTERELVTIILHEITHRTVWIPHHTNFNESLASFVGNRAAQEYFTSLARRCQSTLATDEPLCALDTAGLAAQATTARTIQHELADTIMALYAALDALYRSDLSREEKLAQREEVFRAHTEILRSRFPALTVLTKVDNSEILQLKLYLTGLNDFERLFARSEGRWDTFLEHIRAIGSRMDIPSEDHSERDPFALLASSV